MAYHSAYRYSPERPFLTLIMYGRRLNDLFDQDVSLEVGFQKYEILAICGDGTCFISGTYSKFGLAAQREMLVFDHHH